MKAKDLAAWIATVPPDADIERWDNEAGDHGTGGWVSLAPREMRVQIILQPAGQDKPGSGRSPKKAG